MSGNEKENLITCLFQVYQTHAWWILKNLNHQNDSSAWMASYIWKAMSLSWTTRHHTKERDHSVTWLLQLCQTPVWNSSRLIYAYGGWIWSANDWFTGFFFGSILIIVRRSLELRLVVFVWCCVLTITSLMLLLWSETDRNVLTLLLSQCVPRRW